MRASWLLPLAFALAACGNPLGAGTKIDPNYVPGYVGGVFVGATGCTGASVTAASVGYMPIADCFLQRASTATYFDVTGVMRTAAMNVVRVDYSPSTHALNGFLIEPSATNLVPNSTTLSNAAYWVPNGTPTFNATASSPDGGTAVSVSSATAFSGTWHSIAVSVSTAYTMSAYVKNLSGGPSVRIGFSNGWIDVNALTGAITAQASALGAPNCTDAGNSWFRCVISTTTPAAGASAAVIAYNRTNTAGENAFWGIQVELGSSVTSYIPTATGAVTRSADIYQLP